MARYYYSKYYTNYYKLSWGDEIRKWFTQDRLECQSSFNFNAVSGTISLSGSTRYLFPESVSGSTRRFTVGATPGYYRIEEGVVSCVVISYRTGTPGQNPPGDAVYGYRPAVITASMHRGDLISDSIIAEDGTYPNNGVHTDGYWYVRGLPVFPEFNMKVNGALKTSSDGWVKVNGVLRPIKEISVKVNGSLKKL